MKPLAPPLTRTPALPDVIRARDRYDVRAEKGDVGQAKVLAALLPLFGLGWKLVGENIEVVFEDGTRHGDIDILVRSPRGLGFSIEAKNYDNVIVRYVPGQTRLAHLIVFQYRYDRPVHQVVRSLEAADWAHGQPQFGFTRNDRMYAIMCFLENENVKVPEINA